MASTNRAVFGIYPDRPAVEEAITHFLRAGFRQTDVSALFPENPGTKDLGHEKNTKAPEAAAVGGLVGGIICGVFAWAVGMGYVNLPALSMLVSAGPIVSALCGFGAGAIAGGILGALVGLPMPEYEARRYAGRVREGGVLMSVHCDNHDWTKRAKSIFRESGAKYIAACAEKTGDFANADKPAPRIRTITRPDSPLSRPEPLNLDETQPLTVPPEERPYRSLSS